MSDVLQEARRQMSSNGELPFAIQLELYVDDRDVVAELAKYGIEVSAGMVQKVKRRRQRTFRSSSLETR